MIVNQIEDKIELEHGIFGLKCSAFLLVRNNRSA